jgi:cytochrome P450
VKPERVQSRALLGVLREFSRHPVDFLCRLDARGAPVMRSRLGPLPQWFVFDAELARELLQQRNDDFNRPPYMRHLVSTVTGKTLFTTTGDEWRQRRRLLQPDFHRAHVTELIAGMAATVGAELDRWPSPGVFDVQDAMARLTLQVAERSMFSMGGRSTHEDTELSQSFRAVVGWLTDRFYNPRSLPSFVPSKKNRQMHRARRKLRGLVHGLIRERRARPAERHDVLQVLLDARFESGARLNDDVITAECLGFLFAGHETTASTLTWACYELARHPLVAAAVRAEIDGVCGDATPCATDLSKLTRLGRVVDETLRLHPPAWGIARTSKRSSRLGPYKVPWGTGIIVSVYTIHRSARYWDNPERFDPDRFLSGHDPRRPAYLPLAFGAGPRMCIGAAFAAAEARLVLTLALQRLELSTLSDEAPVFYPEFSLRIRDGLLLNAQPRHHPPG